MASHAVVVGASMAGLLAARALADHAEQVTLVERDAFPPVGEGRRGVPQARHVHGLMARGREILEEFFPGLTRELVDRGAPLVDTRACGRWFARGGCYHRRATTSQETLLVSRPLLEGTVRARVLALPNVRAIERCDALGLQANDDRSRVTGVRVLRQQPGSAEEVVSADLVVDASGRGSRAPTWLESLGYAPPHEEQMRVGLAYASRYYRRRPGDLGGDQFAIVSAEPETRRAGVAVAQEGDRWHVTLIGYLGEQPPTEEQGFLAFARSLPAPDLYDLIKHAEPLTDPVPTRFPANLRRRYEKLDRFPDGFLVIGDALCSFNPIYAQGMTVAALEALALGECLRAGGARLTSRFFRRASAVVDMAWSVSAGGDLRFPQIEGERTPMVRFVNWYLGRLHLAAHADPEVAAAFQKVVNMLAPPPSVLHPRVSLRVLRGNLRPAMGARPGASAAASVAPRG